MSKKLTEINKELTDTEVNKIIAEFMEDTLKVKYFQLQEEIKHLKEGVLDTRHLELARLQYSFGFNPTSYTNSLDALVPVWEKLNVIEKEYDSWEYCFSLQYNSFTILHITPAGFGDHVKKIAESDAFFDKKIKTIQQSAAYATAKAILKLKGDL